MTKKKKIKIKNFSVNRERILRIRKSGKIFSYPRCVVKRHGACHAYDERKVYASCYFSCRSCHLSEIKSEGIANKVSKSVKLWIRGKKEVSSEQIFKLITKELKRHDEDASFMYETHRDIS